MKACVQRNPVYNSIKYFRLLQDSNPAQPDKSVRAKYDELTGLRRMQLFFCFLYCFSPKGFFGKSEDKK